MKKNLLIGLTVVVVLGLLAGELIFLRGNEDTWLCSNGQWVKHGNPSASQPTTPCAGATVCTMEAKICPDGSSVGRTGANCEFAECPAAKLANPASVNCKNKGGVSEIITAADGSQSGVCKFPDGTKCDEWALFRNECQAGVIDKSDIIKRLFADKYQKPLTEISIKISRETENHVRGGVTIGEPGPGAGGNFLAAKVNGAWQIIFDGNGQISCKLVNSYGFPAEMISDCIGDGSTLIFPNFSYKFSYSQNSQESTKTDISILENGKKIANLSYPQPAGSLKFLGGDENLIYFTVIPDGLGGYYIYDCWFNLYKLNLKTKAVTMILNNENMAHRSCGSIALSNDLKLLAYQSDLDTVTIKNLLTNVLKNYTCKEASQGKIGNIKFSPDNSKLAFPVGYGPDKEYGEVYVMNLSDGDYSLYTKNINSHLQVSGWKNNSEVIVIEN